MDSRIEVLPAEIRSLLTNAPPGRLRDVAVAVVSVALDAIPEHPRELDTALQELRAGVVTEKTAALVREISARLDEAYLQQHADGTHGWEDAFALARAANSLSDAFDPDPYIAASRSTYEAFHALQDPDLIRSAIEGTLNSN